MSKPKQTKQALPRGLWVGLKRKPVAEWKVSGVPECYQSFYYKIQKKGLPQRMRAMPSFVKTQEQAEIMARAEFERLELELYAKRLKSTEVLKSAIRGVEEGRWCSVGEYMSAWEEVAKMRKLSEYKRVMSSGRRVLAVARGLLAADDKRRIDTEGGRIMRALDALPMSVFCEETKLAYMAAMQGGKLNLDKQNPPLVNGTINSTLTMARVLFAPGNRGFGVAELVVPWELVRGFCEMLLPEADLDVAEALPSEGAFKAMMKAWQELQGGTADDEELALCNELFRLLGLRSGELVMARESWLWEGRDGRCFLWVKNRPEEAFSCKTPNAAKLPLTEDLARRLRVRCAAARAKGAVNPFLLLPELPGGGLDELGAAKELPERYELVRVKHNAWLKGFIGEVRSGQGNHRLRKFVATQLYAAELRKPDGTAEKAASVVKEYLRHSKEATALLHYIARNDERLPTVTDETLAAWMG